LDELNHAQHNVGCPERRNEYLSGEQQLACLCERVSYATLRSALAAHANNPDAQAAVASLPATDPTFSYAGSHLWSLPEAYGRMLGLSTTVYSPDDTITLNTSYTWSYGQDVIDALEHEISEGGMGRVRSRRPEHRLEHDGSVPIVVAAVPALPPGTAPRSTPCGFVTDELDLRLA
jgi:hypothetical protein